MLRGPLPGHRYVLATDAETVLGRHPGCDVVLASLSVSRRHATLRPDADRFRLTDLGSLDGSYVNGSSVDSALLRSGDEITVGLVRLVFDDGRPSPGWPR